MGGVRLPRSQPWLDSTKRRKVPRGNQPSEPHRTGSTISNTLSCTEIGFWSSMLGACHFDLCRDIETHPQQNLLLSSQLLSKTARQYRSHTCVFESKFSETSVRILTKSWFSSQIKKGFWFPPTGFDLDLRSESRARKLRTFFKTGPSAVCVFFQTCPFEPFVV